MDKREFKDRIYGDLATVTKAMANSHRLEIIELLAQSEYPVEQIAEHTNLSVANASQHLQTLKAGGLVEISRKGNFIYYKLAGYNVLKTWKALRDLGTERLVTVAETVREFRRGKFELESVTIDELVKKIKTGKVTILDVRPETEYKSAHIANARSIPISELKRRLKELPRRTEIVAYCRGPFCVFSDEAVALLIKEGYKAKRLQEGFPDWHTMGLPIQVN